MKKSESLEKIGGGSVCGMWGERKTADSSFLKSDYSLLNETAQFNCPEFIGLTIEEDYTSRVLWGKRLPGDPTFRANCYYRCGNSLLATKELLQQEIRVGFIDGVVRRQLNCMPVKGLGSYWS